MHKKVTLKPTKEKSILRRHPWVFSGAIKNIEQGIINGDIVEIINNKGRFLGYGHYNEGSIAVRLFEFSAVVIADDTPASSKVAIDTGSSKVSQFLTLLNSRL